MNQHKVAIHWQGPKKFSFPAGVTKVMDPGTDDPDPNKDKLVRFYISEAITNQWIKEGKAGLEKWWNWIRPKILKIAHWSGKIVIEGPNEAHPMHDWAFRKALDDFSFSATLLIEALAAEIGREIYFAAYQFSVGWPNWGDIRDFRRSLKIVHYGASHEYNSPDLYRVGRDGKPCWVGRILETFKEMRDFGLRIPPWLITEFEVDRLLTSEHDPESFVGGWMTVDNDPAKFANQVKWAVDTYYGRAPEVAAVFFYTGTPYHPWETYEATEPLMEHLADYAAGRLPDITKVHELNIVNMVGRIPQHPLWNHADPRVRVRYLRRRRQDILDTGVHHMGFAYKGKNLKDSIRLVRNIAKRHIRINEWPGGPYHFYADPWGNLIQVNAYESVAYGAGKFNDHSMQICMMWAAHLSDPPRAMLETTIAACNMLGKPVWAHNEVMRTECPGNRVKEGKKYVKTPDGEYVYKDWWEDMKRRVPRAR